MNLEKGGISSAALHIIAMALMLCDHIWAAGLSDAIWLTGLGRMAFPIFAFLLVEGFHHTSSRKRYVRRLLIFAIVSEIPFDLIAGGSVFYPYHQNIYWTLLIGFGCMAVNEKAARSGSGVLRILTAVLSAACGYMLGFLLFVDYYGIGVITILAFYFFREDDFLSRLAQFGTLYYLNIEMLGGLVFPFVVFGRELSLPLQGLALLALPVIWSYRGRQGHHSRAFQYFCYAFYPAHLTILALIARAV